MTPASNARPALSVLIVEDDEPTLKIIHLLVAKRFPDLFLRTAGGGRQGLELCGEQLPDLVITDINMAGMNGIQMAREIKLLKQDAFFIVLTGNSDKRHLEDFQEIGAADYIVKPINFKKLCAAIEKCVQEIRGPLTEVDANGC
jgi:two-component system, response regulator YesN